MPKDGILESVPWYFDDWWNDDAAMELPAPARLLYLETIFVASKFGLVPSSYKSMSKKVKLPERFCSQHWAKVQPFFYQVEGGWAHRKVDEIRSKKFKVKDVKSVAGAAGNKSRWSHMRSKDDRTEIADAIQTGSQNDRSRARSPALTPIKNIQEKFAADCERFEREYPQAIDDLNMQDFISQVCNESDQELFFRVLAANNATEKWQNGYSPGPSKYLTGGLWRKMPKSGPATISEPDRHKIPAPEYFVLADELKKLSVEELVAIAGERHEKGSHLRKRANVADSILNGQIDGFLKGRNAI